MTLHQIYQDYLSYMIAIFQLHYLILLIVYILLLHYIYNGMRNQAILMFHCFPPDNRLILVDNAWDNLFCDMPRLS